VAAGHEGQESEESESLQRKKVASGSRIIGSRIRIPNRKRKSVDFVSFRSLNQRKTKRFDPSVLFLLLLARHCSECKRSAVVGLFFSRKKSG
jgi:hypothetical protein